MHTEKRGRGWREGEKESDRDRETIRNRGFALGPHKPTTYTKTVVMAHFETVYQFFSLFFPHSKL